MLYKNHAHIAAPLKALLNDLPQGAVKKKLQQPIALTDEALQAYHELVQIITEPPVLHLSTTTGTFSIDTDASSTAVGCALYQEDANGV